MAPSDIFNQDEKFIVYNATGKREGSRDYEIDSKELSKLYTNLSTGGKVLKGNPKVVLEYTMVMYHPKDNWSTPAKLVVLGRSVNQQGLKQNYDRSDVIHIEIPLNLPAPSVSLKVAPARPPHSLPLLLSLLPMIMWRLNWIRRICQIASLVIQRIILALALLTV